MNASQEAQLWQDIGGMKAHLGSLDTSMARLLERAFPPEPVHTGLNGRKAPLLAGGIGGVGTLGFAVLWALERFASI